jgi:outer membrane protein TolC
VLGLVGGSPARAQDEPQTPPPVQEPAVPPTLHGSLSLSLDDAIAMGIENNLDVEILRHQPLIREQEEIVAKGAYDPELFSSVRYDNIEDPNANVLLEIGESQGTADNLVNRESTLGEAGLRGLIPLLGGSYQIDYGGSRVETDVSVQGLSPEYTAGLAASLSLPILRGLFWSEPWTAVKLSGVAYGQSLDEFRRDLIDVVVGIELAYWNLVAREENLRAAEKSLDASEAVLEQTRVQHEVGVVSRVEVVEAEAGVAEREFNRIQAENEYRRSQDDLIDRVLGPHLTATSRLEIQPTDRPERMHQFIGGAFEFDAEESVQLAFENRPELAIQHKVIEQAQIGLQFAKNQRLPQLDAIGGYGWEGIAGDLNPDCSFQGVSCTVQGIPRHYHDTSDDFFNDAGNAQWYGGAVFSLPLPNRSARANVSKSEFELSRARTGLRREEQRIVFEVRDRLRNVRDSAQGIEAAERRRAAAEEQHRAETIRLEHGESTPFDVLLRERDLFDAESQKIAALQAYRSSLARLDQAQGTTLRSNNVAVDDARRLR